MVGTTEKPLTNTAYAILGLLSLGEEPSGYDVVKAVEGSVGFFWAPAKSQIYTELKRIVAAGYASEREVAQSGRPDKRVYTPTPAGEEALAAWLLAADDEPEEIKSVFLLKLFYGHRLTREDTAAKIRRYREWALDMLARYREIERQIDEQGGHEGRQFYPWVTLTFGVAHAECGVRWADRTLELLETEGGGDGRAAARR